MGFLISMALFGLLGLAAGCGGKLLLFVFALFCCSQFDARVRR